MQRSRRQRDDTKDNDSSQWLHQALAAKEISTDLLQRCFQSLQEQIWWRIVSLDDSYDDIPVGIGIKWNYILMIVTTHQLRSAVHKDCQFPKKGASTLRSMD